MDYLSVSIVTQMSDGSKTLEYNHTPEEFVEYLRARKKKMLVATESCPECPLLGKSALPVEQVDRAESQYVKTHRILECLKSAVARFPHYGDAIDIVYCAEFFHRHWKDNQYIMAVVEAGLLDVVDISAEKTLKESGHELLTNWTDLFTEEEMEGL